MWTVDRRRFLIAGLSAPLVGAVPACAGERGTGGAGETAGGAPFVSPRELMSTGGRLEVDLPVEQRMVPFGTGTRYAYTYAGTTPGPTLRVRPGDTLVVRLHNRLDEPTNLHTHGLHVDPTGGSDNVFVAVAPGDSRTYTYRIPADHRSGTFWYHPHHHGMVAPQVAAGLAGMIVIEDRLDELAEMAGAAERLLVLSDPRVGEDASVLDVSPMEVMQGREGDDTLVNGMLRPVITASAGRTERWRILNASPSRYHRVSVAGHRLTLIATDGGRRSVPLEVDEVLLAPGERAEVMLAPRPGRHEVRSLPYDRGRGAMGNGMGGGMGNGMGGDGRGPSDGAGVLAVLDVASSEAPAGAIPRSLAPADAVALPAATGRRRLELAMGMGGGGGMMGGGGMGGGMMAFTIDGATFDAGRTDITVAAGAVEDWTLVNRSSMDHPFHLHVWPFQVVGADGSGDGSWKDTVNVPAASSVTIRVPFVGLTGRTVYHCHILDHEDQGMMGVIEVR